MDKKPHSSRSIMLITLGVAILLSLLVWPLSKLGKGDASAPGGDEAELRVQPVARVEMRQAPVVRSDGKPRSGEAVYTAICQTCHAAGLAGAPKTGDKAAWAPRIASGSAALLKTALNGKGGMPARGGGADLTDAELKAAVEYIVSKSK
ncbi:MAG: c-type cytochrome [Propionivibrio sp.]